MWQYKVQSNSGYSILNSIRSFSPGVFEWLRHQSVLIYKGGNMYSPLFRPKADDLVPDQIIFSDATVSL